MSSIFLAWHQYEAAFIGQPRVDFAQQHMYIPVATAAVYVLMATRGPRTPQHRKTVRVPLAVWNLLLALFSLGGTIRTLPRLTSVLSMHGFLYTVCAEAEHWYLNGPTGAWVWLFVLSKFPELIDTVFLILSGKPVLFLHWYHHASVLVYTWHAYCFKSSCGLWYACMNYIVHTIMYLYYFFTAIGWQTHVAWCAPLITLVQIAQMFLGLFLSLLSMYVRYTAGPLSCAVTAQNASFALCMYLTYLVLFCVFFVNKYHIRHPKPAHRIK
jgi:hypothetical protein